MNIMPRLHHYYSTFLQGHHADCSNYPMKCELCHSDVPRHNVRVDVLAKTT